MEVIPFKFPEKPLRGKELMAIERELMDCQKVQDESLGHLLALSKQCAEPETKELIYTYLTDFVVDHLGDKFTRGYWLHSDGMKLVFILRRLKIKT